MLKFMHYLWFVFIGANSLCLAGFCYAKYIYNKRFNPRRVHYFSVALVTVFLVYLLLSIFFGAAFFPHHKLVSLGFLAALVNPFLIGYFGNDYFRAGRYYTIQILLFILTLVFLLTAVPA